jgi:hypothetical protein
VFNNMTKFMVGMGLSQAMTYVIVFPCDLMSLVVVHFVNIG